MLFVEQRYPIPRRPATPPTELPLTYQDLFQLINTIRALILDLDTEFATKLSDAPEDGTIYGRQDGEWVEAGGGGGGSSSAYPINSQSADYTLVLTDAGKCIYHPSSDTSNRVWTIPDHSVVEFPLGSFVWFENDYGAGEVKITPTTDTLSLVGTAGETGAVILAEGGRAQLIKVLNTRWRIDGDITLAPPPGVTPTTWNPADKGSGVTLSGGDLTANTSHFNYSVRSVFGASSGKWYWEYTVDGVGTPGWIMAGIGNASAPVSSGGNAYPGSNVNSWSYFGYDGEKYHNAINAAYGTSLAAGNVLSVLLDMDAGTLTFWENGSTYGTAFTGITGTIYAMFGSGASSSCQITANFGATPFAYTPPVGYNEGFGPI